MENSERSVVKNVKIFWSFANKLKKNTINSIKVGSHSVDERREMANAFADHFSTFYRASAIV